ncbi:MAG: hypothetical protein ACYC3I_05145, partial [Gemmataceae bacterium]
PPPATQHDAEAAIFPQTPHPQLLSPEYRGEGSSAVLLENCLGCLVLSVAAFLGLSFIGLIGKSSNSTRSVSAPLPHRLHNNHEADTEAKKQAEEEPKRAEEKRKAEDPAEIKRCAEAEKKAEEERNRRMKEEAEARKVREKVKAEQRAKDAEVSAASDLKFAKGLYSASLDAVGRESVRLEREYINDLYEIIKKYPMTKAAKEAKELLDKMGR